MQRVLTFFLMFGLFMIAANAQQTKSVTGAYTYYAPENVTLEEAKHIAVNRAKISAIADAFGTLVSQNNATVISNTNGKSENRFLSLGGSEVKGEWIETTKEPTFDIKYEHGQLIVSVILRGLIREFPKNNLTFSSMILRNGTTEKYESYDFKNGDDMYLRFSSPTNGYLIAYMYDETSDMAVCILPYIADNSVGYMRIEGGKDYLFFKKNSQGDIADEYTLTANNGNAEFETLYLIFSTEPIYTISHDVSRNDAGMRSVSHKEFTKWLVENRKKPNVKVTKQMITIKP